MKNTILFDLDGTLLPIEIDFFMKDYFDALCNKCKDIIHPEALKKSVLASTHYMITNKDKTKTNMNAFMEDFEKRIDVGIQEVLPILEDFYLNEFDELGTVTKANETVPKIISLLKSKGYDIVVATNPLFPRQAILHRIRWADLRPEDFLLITDYETMHFCKPNIEYYEEILSIIERKPQNCIMVGNDAQEDLVAGKLGMETFLLTDHLINRDTQEPKSDYRGNYSELLEFVISLPSLKKE